MRGVARLVCGAGLLAMLAVPSLGDELARARVAVPNGEDMALTGDARWVIVSSMPDMGQPGGGLYGVDVETGDVRQLPVDEIGERAGVLASCEGPESPQSLSPHGIAIHDRDGRETLFVVNHGSRESVELYEVVSGNTLALRWVDCLVLPEGTSANAVAVTQDGRVFVTNMNAAATRPDSGAGESERWMGNVLVWTASSGWEPLAESAIFAANGLLVEEDGSTVYVASWAAGEVIRLTTDASVPRAVLSLPFLPDNLRWGDGGQILAAGLRGTPEQVVACVMGSCEQQPLTAVAYIDPARLEATCIRELGLGMGTSAIAVGSDLWVGPVRGDQLWIVDGQPGLVNCRESGVSG